MFCVMRSMQQVALYPKALIGSACLAFMLVTPAAAKETVTEGIGRPLVDIEQAKVAIAIGDKLKINVFERLGTPEDEASKNTNLIERVELSCEYAVQADGNLYLPLLGPQPVYGKTAPEALALIEKAFQDTFGKEGRVTLAITARSPVYIVGRVAHPGTFDYTGGMTVLHALAQAGGIERAVPGEVYETVREQRKVEEGRDRQKRIIARLETLRAERASVPAVPSAKLLDLAGEDEAMMLMSDQRNVRALAIEARQIRLRGLDGTITAATRELAIQRAKVQKMQDYSSAKAQRVTVLEQLATRGNGGSYQMLQAKSEYGDFQERMSEVQAVISQVEERLAQAQNEKSRIVTEAQLDLERDIATVEEQQAEVAHQIATSAQLVLLAQQSFKERVLSPEDIRFTLVRMTPNGPRSMEADETMSLMPGDLIKVHQPDQRPYGSASLQVPAN